MIYFLAQISFYWTVLNILANVIFFFFFAVGQPCWQTFLLRRTRKPLLLSRFPTHTP